MKGGRKHKTDKRRMNKKALIVGVALAVIMVGGAVAAVLMSSPSPALNKDNNNEVIQRIVAPISENVPVLAADGGSSNITMVEFGDYQCQYCARFHNETKNQIMNNFVDTGQIRFVFKDFVINDLPSDRASTLAAEASYCAADQGKYWQYHDELYDNSRGENTGWVTENSLKQFATRIGIQNLTEFSGCLENHTHQDLVEANTQLANGIGLRSTPSFVIISNETVPIAIEGAQPFPVFKQAIDDVLANVSRT
ncbi:MAG: thioredoxin domain-containing protein [Nitrososphaeraceae archaeon]|nr:thioredoxin domain-containing protein [Nitrososphaeraceae archaeon]